MLLGRHSTPASTVRTDQTAMTIFSTGGHLSPEEGRGSRLKSVQNGEIWLVVTNQKRELIGNTKLEELLNWDKRNWYSPGVICSIKVSIRGRHGGWPQATSTAPRICTGSRRETKLSTSKVTEKTVRDLRVILSIKPQPLHVAQELPESATQKGLNLDNYWQGIRS